jgi:predicted Zn-ribbon and HTH transcriptional regulator
LIKRTNAGSNSGSGQLKISQTEWSERASKLNIEWLDDVASRHTKAQARCLTCDHVWLANPGTISKGSGCPKCKNLERNLARRVSPEIWKKRAGEQNLVWLEDPENNIIKKKIQCQTCNFVWAARPDLIQRGVGCPKCSGTFVENQDWLDRAAAVGLRWVEIPRGSRTPTLAECLTCGLVWKTNPGAVTSGTGCPDCAETGYKVGQPGLFYWVERDNSQGRAARKIGITNVASSKVRLSLWRRQGFSVVRQVTHENGAIILRLEQDLLHWLRHDLAIPQYLDPEEMPKGGATETLPRDLPSDFVLAEKIDELFSIIVTNHQG